MDLMDPFGAFFNFATMRSRFTFDGRRAVDAAGDYVRLRSLRFAPTHIHRPFYVAFQGGNFNLT